MAIRLVQVGMGGWGRNWATNIIQRSEDVALVACVDLDAEMLAQTQPLLYLCLLLWASRFLPDDMTISNRAYVEYHLHARCLVLEVLRAVGKEVFASDVVKLSP